MSKIILAATTDAAASEDFTVVNRQTNGLFMPAHFTCPGLAGVETGTLQKKNNNGSYSDYYIDGVIQVITATNTGVVAYAPGIYRINKDATVANVPVEVSTNEIP